MTWSPADRRLAVTRARSRALRIRRLPRSFRRWPAVLASLVGGSLAGRPRDLRVTTVGGAVITCPNTPPARSPLLEIYLDDCYRFEPFLDGLKGPLRALDIGAHVGCFAVRLSELRPGTAVCCYEPAASTFAYLEANAARLAGRGNLDVHQAAVAASAGTLALVDEGGASCASSAFLDSAAGARVAVPCVALAEVLRVEGPFDLVKIDCEGAEYEAVLATRRQDWAGVERVVVEYHPVPGRSWEELAAFFSAAGLHLVDRLEHPSMAGFGNAWLRRA